MLSVSNVDASQRQAPCPATTNAKQESPLTFRPACDAISTVASSPNHLWHQVVSSLNDEILGVGRRASAHRFQSADHFILRSVQGLQTSADLRVIPVEYCGTLQDIDRNPLLGTPQAIIVDTLHRLARMPRVTPQQALCSTSKVIFTLQRFCKGTQASESFRDAYKGLMHGPAVHNVTVRLQTLQERPAKVLVQAGYTPSKITYEPIELARNKQSTRNLREILDRELKTPEAIAYRSLFLRFQKYSERVLMEPRKVGLDDLLQEQQLLLQQIRDTSLTENTPAQKNFYEAYVRYAASYTCHVQSVSRLPLSAFEEAIGAIRESANSAGAYTINLNHGRNTLIDFKNGHISFVDLDFDRTKVLPSVDRFFKILMGRDIDNEHPWSFIVQPENMTLLRSAVELLAKKVMIAARRQNVQWSPYNQGNLSRVCRYFRIPIPNEATLTSADLDVRRPLT